MEDSYNAVIVFEGAQIALYERQNSISKSKFSKPGITVSASAS